VTPEQPAGREAHRKGRQALLLDSYSILSDFTKRKHLIIFKEKEEIYQYA
jgi:hypothetical protein